jgi:hypothetical protein
MGWVLAIPSVVSIVFLARPAQAQDRAPDSSKWGLRLDVAPGLSNTSGSVAADFFDLGATGLFRWRQLELGALATTSFNFSSEARNSYGGLAGAGGYLGTNGAFDLLAEGGAHAYSGIGGCAGDGCGLGSDTGASGTVPYAGLRAGIALVPGSPDPDYAGTRFLIGLWIYVTRDLSSETVTDGSKTENIGGATEGGVALRIGADAAWP